MILALAIFVDGYYDDKFPSVTSLLSFYHE